MEFPRRKTCSWLSLAILSFCLVGFLPVELGRRLGAQEVRPAAEAPVAARPVRVDRGAGLPPEVEAVPPRFFRLPHFRRGDTNGDGTADVSDGVAILDALFNDVEPLSCRNAADTNGDRGVDLSDATFLFGHLFLGGREPPEPGITECGVDRGEDALSCENYPACEDPLPLIAHVLNRVTFGPTEELYTEIQTEDDLLAYLEEQLNPPANFDQSLHEPEIHAQINTLDFGFPGDGGTQSRLERLSGMLLVDAVQSRWQLLHVLAQFWNNHFHSQTETLSSNFFDSRGRGGGASAAFMENFPEIDTDASGFITLAEWDAFRAQFPMVIPWEDFRRDSLEDEMVSLEEFLAQGTIAFWKYAKGRHRVGIAADLERREYSWYRRLAFGNFRDLLESCAKSVPMLIYLNTFENTLQAPNENYAREFLELQSLGADRVYTQRDIEELSRIFTGWTVDWVERSAYDPIDLNFLGHPETTRITINQRLPGPERLQFPTRENWEDDLYTWAFVFGNAGPRGRFGDGHDWERKDLFLEQYGGVDSLGNPVSPFDAVSIGAVANAGDQNAAAAMTEFNQVLDRVVSFRDCSKFISTKLIQLFVTDDLGLLQKTRAMPQELQQAFDSVDANGDGIIVMSEWEEPIALVLPNGRPPDVFTELDTNGDGQITALEYQEPDLLLDAMDAWRDSDGEIREVVRAILYSEEFLSLKFYRAKVKTPLEIATSTIRALDGQQTVDELRRTVAHLEEAGQELFAFPEPTGESELAVDGMHTVGLLGRLKFLNLGARPRSAAERPFSWDWNGIRERWSLETPEDITDYFSRLLLNGDILPGHVILVGSTSFVPSTRQIGFLLSLPQFQKQ